MLKYLFAPLLFGFFMGKKAQAGLEYLMVYGWVLVLVMTLVNMIAFAASAPLDSSSFSSSDPASMPLKGALILDGEVEILLGNSTGGRITVTGLSLDGSIFGYGAVTLNGIWAGEINEENPLLVGPGGELYIKGITHSGSGSGEITVAYRDSDGIGQSVIVSGKTATG